MLDSICGGLAATLNVTVIVAAVLVLSNFTYLYVELPGSRLLRHIFRTSAEFSGSSAAPSARPSST
jgi:peptidoglycan/LPS O-acetylase OafA/YrhL